MSTVLGSYQTPSASSTARCIQRDSYDTLRQIVSDLDSLMASAVTEIHGLNERARMLSFNAKIEAGRAGGSVGAAFGVVAKAMQELSERTSGVADSLRAETRDQIRTVQATVEQIATEVQGERLADMALTNVDLLDRNLYERTCDVRWWATDPAIVESLVHPSAESADYAARRMSVILNAYTVYFDLVIADVHGRIVANGRPERYISQGSCHARRRWFEQGMRTTSADEFGFESVHESSLVNGESVLVYSSGIRPNGQPKAPPIGVLGVVFDWNGLSQPVIQHTKIPPHLKDRCRVSIVDNDGKILADLDSSECGKHITLPQRESLFRQERGFVLEEIDGERVIIAHALAPGFETYSTGWHSVIVQPV